MGAKRLADNELHTQVAIKTEADVYSRKIWHSHSFQYMILSISGNYLCMSEKSCKKFMYFCIWRWHYTVQFYLHLSLFSMLPSRYYGEKKFELKFLTIFMLDDAFGARHSQSKWPLAPQAGAYFKNTPHLGVYPTHNHIYTRLLGYSITIQLGYQSSKTNAYIYKLMF